MAAPDDWVGFGVLEEKKEEGWRCREIRKEWAAEEKRPWCLGDRVMVWHAKHWRRGEILRVHSTENMYDVSLQTDGSWTPEEIKAFRALFKRFDTDESGFVDLKELGDMLAELEHPEAFDEEAVQDIFRRMDKDNSGTINFEEFCDLVYIELKELCGVETYLFKLPAYKLYIPPEHNPPPRTNPLDLPRKDAFSHAILLRKKERAAWRRLQARKRLDQISQPRRVTQKKIEFMPSQVIRGMNRGASRAQLALNIFDPSQRDRFSKDDKWLRRYAPAAADGGATTIDI